jgi:hypothetical protein
MGSYGTWRSADATLKGLDLDRMAKKGALGSNQ